MQDITYATRAVLTAERFPQHLSPASPQQNLYPGDAPTVLWTPPRCCYTQNYTWKKTGVQKQQRNQVHHNVLLERLAFNKQTSGVAQRFSEHKIPLIMSTVCLSSYAVHGWCGCEAVSAFYTRQWLQGCCTMQGALAHSEQLSIHC